MATLKALLPRQTSDRLAFGFMLFAIHLICFFELLVILPYIDSDKTKTYWFHFVFGLFLYVDVISCIWYTISVDTTSGSKILPSVLKPGWRFCSACEANAPPRSHHCWLCERCILKRDHHCTFTGNCIGFTNQRYFMTMILHLTFAAVYCNYLNFDYTWEVLDGFNVKSVFTMFMPLLAWVFGLAETFTFAVAFVSALCVIGGLLLVAFTSYHFVNLQSGQTTYERAHNIKEYDLGLGGNLKEVFGKNWYLAWLSPWISSPLPNDGITFQKKGKYEDVKDL